MEHQYLIIFILFITGISFFTNVSTQVTSENATKIAQDIRNIISHLKRDERKIVQVLTERSIEEIKEIRKSYFHLYNENLTWEIYINGKFITTFLQITLASYKDPNEYIAKEVHTALNNNPVDYDYINHELLTRDNPEIEKMIKVYKYLYKRDLVTTIKEKTDGDYAKLLTKLLTPPFRSTEHVKYMITDEQGRFLSDLDRRNCNVSSNEKLMLMFATASYKQIKAVVEHYDYRIAKEYEASEDILKKCCINPLRDAYLKILDKSINNPLMSWSEFGEVVQNTFLNQYVLTRLIMHHKRQNDFGIIEKDFMAVFKPPKKKPVANARFNATRDAQRIRKSVLGMNGNWSKFYEIAYTYEKFDAFVLIKTSYFDQYKMDILQDMKKSLTVSYNDVVIGLLIQPDEYYASEEFYAFKRFVLEFCDYNCINQLLCILVKPEIELVIASINNSVYDEELFTAVEKNATLVYYNVFIKNLLTASPRTSEEVNTTQIDEQMNAIVNLATTCDCSVNSNEKLMLLMAKASFAQIRAVVNKYDMINNITAEEVFKKCCEEPWQGGYRSIVQFAKNSTQYFVDMYNKTLGVLKTNLHKSTSLEVSANYKRNLAEESKHKVTSETPVTHSVKATTENPGSSEDYYD